MASTADSADPNAQNTVPVPLDIKMIAYESEENACVKGRCYNRRWASCRGYLGNTNSHSRRCCIRRWARTRLRSRGTFPDLEPQNVTATVFQAAVKAPRVDTLLSFLVATPSVDDGWPNQPSLLL